MFIAYDVALDLVRALRPVVAQLRKYSPEAADQVERAASSIVLNLAEGRRRHGPGRCVGLAGRLRAGAPAARSRVGPLVGLTRRSRAKDGSLLASGAKPPR